MTEKRPFSVWPVPVAWPNVTCPIWWLRITAVLSVPLKIYSFDNIPQCPVSPEAPINHSSLPTHMQTTLTLAMCAEAHTQKRHFSTHNSQYTPAVWMAMGSCPALFIGVDGFGLLLGETSSVPTGYPLLLVPVSLFIPVLKLSLMKSVHPYSRWRVKSSGKPSDYGAASLEGQSYSDKLDPLTSHLSTTVFQIILN